MTVYDFDLLLPIALFFIGALLHRFPPKKINSFAGYRTQRSMENQRNWDYANRRTGLILMIVAMFLLPVIMLSRALLWSDPDTVLLTNTFFSLPFIFMPIVVIEPKLKKGIE
jgi:uncharacterized membrane protein